MAIVFGDQPEPAKYLLRDFDGKFPPESDAILAASGTTVKKVGPHVPILNAFAERWVLSIRSECLNHFLVFGEAHLRYLVTSYLDYYNRLRPYQRKDNRPLTGLDPPEVLAVAPDESRLPGRTSA